MSNRTITWVVVAGVAVLLLILVTLFGAKNVSGGLRAFVLVILLLGLIIVVGQKLFLTPSISSQAISHAEGQVTQRPQERVAYHAIVRREGGKIIEGYVIGLLREGQKGYTPQLELGIFLDYREATNKADQLNAQTGLSKSQINRMVNRWSA